MINTNSTHEQILAVIDNWTKAIRDADLPEILKNHTEDVLMFDVPVPMQSRGLEEYKRPGNYSLNIVREGKVHLSKKNLRSRQANVLRFAVH